MREKSDIHRLVSSPSWRTGAAPRSSNGSRREDSEQSSHRATGLRTVAGLDASGVASVGSEPEKVAEILVATTTPALGAGLEVWVEQAPFPWRSAGVVADADELRARLAPPGVSMVAASTCLHGELVAAIASQTHPKALVLLLTDAVDASYEADLLRSGADGVIPLRSGQRKFVESIKALLEGRSITSLGAMRQLRDGPSRAPALPPRMREVIALLAEGRSTAQIADELCVSLGTVKTHINRAAVRLGLSGRNELVARARSILDEDPVS
jgi:DNA-binding NarL/FixJ family response regulator